MSNDDTKRVAVSLVVPIYAAEPYLDDLVDQVQHVRDMWNEARAPVEVTELILVDDAAIDGSAVLMKRLADECPWIVRLHLSRNYGQHAATVAGILHASGDWIVTLDEDLQHPPSSIHELLSGAVSHEVDVVYANSLKGPHGGTWRDSASRGFKWFMEWLTGNPHLRHINSFRLIRGAIGRAAASSCGHDTFFDINLSWFTQRIEVLEMELEDTRYIESGKSGYSFRSLVKHALRMLYSSQLRFLELGMGVGVLLCTVSFVGGLYYLVLRLISPEAIPVQGWTSLFLVICLTAGVLALMLGMVLKYLSTLVLNAHGKPVFFMVDRGQDARLAEWFRQHPVLEVPTETSLRTRETV